MTSTVAAEGRQSTSLCHGTPHTYDGVNQDLTAAIASIPVVSYSNMTMTANSMWQGDGLNQLELLSLLLFIL
jgi:hypothetical protein